MKAILVPVCGNPRTIELSDTDTLKDMQKHVGGCIEPMSWVFDDEPSVYVNEEGKFTCRPNRAVYADGSDVAWDGTIINEGDLIDIIFGDFICVGFDPETGADRSVTDEEVERVMERFGSAESLASGFIEAVRIRNGL